MKNFNYLNNMLKRRENTFLYLKIADDDISIFSVTSVVPNLGVATLIGVSATLLEGRLEILCTNQFVLYTYCATQMESLRS